MNEKNDIKLKGHVSDGHISAGVDIEGNQEVVNKFLSGIVPGFIRDGVGILSDRVAFWRWQKQVDIIIKVEEKIASSGLKKQQIPLKVLYPLLQNSSFEEDVDMLEKWANLLANAATGNVEVSPNYPAILNELSPIEVKILDKVFDEVNSEVDYQKRKNMQFSSTIIQTKFDINEIKMDLITENMYRLNLFQSPAGNGLAQDSFPFALRTTKIFEFTTLGYEFVKACRWKVNKN